MHRNSILVVEDDAEINQLITKYLLKEGYDVDSVYNGTDALNIITRKKHEMVILDLMLPEVDGHQVLMKIRQNANIPVLILSAKVEITDRIVGLELGADDYMTKPFSVEELIARVKAQLRRYMKLNSEVSEEDHTLRYNDLELNMQTYSLKIGERSIELTLKEFNIVKLFISSPNRVFTKSQVFNKVWGEACLGDENTVMVHIRRLREKIESDPSNPKYIQTIWGIGYKLA